MCQPQSQQRQGLASIPNNGKGFQGSSTEDYESVLLSLRGIARETKTTIILLSQLDHKLENRREKRPRLSDLPTMMIGQYADLLIFLYRNEYYDPQSEDKGIAAFIDGLTPSQKHLKARRGRPTKAEQVIKMRAMVAQAIAKDGV